MIMLAFAGVTLAAVFRATFVRNLRHAILALWVAGIGVGGLYLALGAELLAILQWVVSTLVAIAFIYFSVTFGEFGDPEEDNESAESGGKKNSKKAAVLPLLAVCLGTYFAMIVGFGAGEFEVPIQNISTTSVTLAQLTQLLTDKHFLSLELLALTLFLVLIGAGVVVRIGGNESP